MNIKFLKLFVLSLVFGGALASCDDKKNGTDDTEVVNYDLTLSAGNPSDNETPLTEGWSWKTGDELAFFNTSFTRNIVKVTYNGTNFTGSVPSVAGKANIAFFYPASAVKQSKSDTTYVRLSYANQDGVNVANYMSGLSMATVDGSKAEATVSMKIINAKANLNFNYQGNPIKDITHVEIYSDKNAMLVAADYNIKEKTFGAETSGNISVVNAGLNGSVSVGLLPAKGVRLCVSVVTGDGKVYLGTQSESINITAGGVYDLTYDCTVFDGKAKIGDYFYSDYTYSSNYEETKNCVGVVFALTDKQGGEINRTLSTGVHGRVVALTDARKTVWIASGKKLFDMPKLTNYDNADGSNVSGYLPFYVSGGSVGYYEDADVKISAALNADGNISSWPNSGALSDFNGLRNTESVDSGYNKYPAGYYATRFNAGGITTWYLPSLGEMALIYALQGNGIIANQEGYSALQEFSYWTSTECSEQKVWVLQVFDGKVYANYKTASYYVRPTLAF